MSASSWSSARRGAGSDRVRLLVVATGAGTRPLALAPGLGINYGVAAFLVKLVISDVSHGLPALLTDSPITLWPSSGRPLLS